MGLREQVISANSICAFLVFMAEFAVNNVLWNISNRLRQVWRCEAEHLMDVTPIAESNDRASYSSDESVDQEPLSKLKTGVSSSSRLFAKSRRNGCSWLSCQTVLALIAFFGFCNVYALRVNLSVALVAMVNDTTKNGTWKFYWREDSTIKGACSLCLDVISMDVAWHPGSHASSCCSVHPTIHNCLVYTITYVSNMSSQLDALHKFISVPRLWPLEYKCLELDLLLRL
jgi:hypothetical protein